MFGLDAAHFTAAEGVCLLVLDVHDLVSAIDPERKRAGGVGSEGGEFRVGRGGGPFAGEIEAEPGCGGGVEDRKSVV